MTRDEVIAWLRKEVERCVQEADGVPVHPAAERLRAAADLLAADEDAPAPTESWILEQARQIHRRIKESEGPALVPPEGEVLEKSEPWSPPRPSDVSSTPPPQESAPAPVDDNEAFKAAFEDFAKNHPNMDSYAMQAFSAGWLAHRAASAVALPAMDERERRLRITAPIAVGRHAAMLRDAVSLLDDTRDLLAIETQRLHNCEQALDAARAERDTERARANHWLAEFGLIGAKSAPADAPDWQEIARRLRDALEEAMRGLDDYWSQQNVALTDKWSTLLASPAVAALAKR